MDEGIKILTFVATAVWNVAPAFLLSLLLGALIRTLKLDGVIRRVFQAQLFLSILLATLIGAFSPFCSCTVVPVVSGLLLSGVPLAPVMAFWIASPTMDLEIFALTVTLLGWPLALARLLATFGVSLAAGYLTVFLVRSGLLAAPLLRGEGAREEAAPGALQAERALPVRPTVVPAGPALLALAAGNGPAGCTSGCSIAAGPTGAQPGLILWLQERVQSVQWGEIGREVRKQGWQLGRWLLLAFFLEALITYYVPQAAIAALLGHDNLLAVPLAALIGIPLYLNNIGALPIVNGLLEQGMQPGAAVAFLVAGPITTIPAMAAVWGIASRRLFAFYLALGMLGAVASGLSVNLFLS